LQYRQLRQERWQDGEGPTRRARFQIPPRGRMLETLAERWTAVKVVLLVAWGRMVEEQQGCRLQPQ
jgi:hypothetical protein